jgi:hypothetical protein
MKMTLSTSHDGRVLVGEFRQHKFDAMKRSTFDRVEGMARE